MIRYHARVLYIDIDCHHGDGVEEAFYTTDRVLTCSFHKQKDYFPGTGRTEDVGKGKGKGYSVNVPLLNGVTDEDYQSIFEPVSRVGGYHTLTTRTNLAVKPGHPAYYGMVPAGSGRSSVWR